MQDTVQAYEGVVKKLKKDIKVLRNQNAVLAAKTDIAFSYETTQPSSPEGEEGRQEFENQEIAENLTFS